MSAASLTAADAARSERWVQPLATALLALTLLYAIIGVPGEDNTDTSQTDRVSPLNSWIWLGLFMLALPVLRRRGRDVAALLAGAWPLLALIGYFALSVTWALDPSASLRRLLFTIVQLILFAILLSGIRRAPIVLVVIAAVCGAGALIDLASWVIDPGFAMKDDGFAGLQGQKNQAGLLMMYGCLAAVPCVWLVRRWLWRGALLVATAMMAALLVATRSTTSQSVVFGAAVAMPLVLLIARLPRAVILAIAAIGVLLPAAGLLGYLVVCGVTGADAMLPLRGVTFTARTDIWSFVIQEIAKRPLFGAGYGSFWSINPAVQPSLKSDQWFGVDVIINEAHNGYLDQLATGGVVGLLGSVFVLGRTIVLAGRALGTTAPAAAAWRDGGLARPTAVFHLAFLLGLVIHNFTESNLFSNNALLAVGFMISALDLERWRIGRHLRQRPPVGGCQRAARNMV